MDLKMKLDELISLDDFNQNNKFTTRKTLSRALENQLEVYYGFSSEIHATYEPIDNSDNGQNKPKRVWGEYEPADLVRLPTRVIKEIWGKGEAYVDLLLDEISPEGYGMIGIIPANTIIITENDLYVKKTSVAKMTQASNDESATPAALKVIGLLMHHLSETPKYKYGEAPNKRAIQELLLSLADKYEIDDVGLRRADERVLTKALEYLQTQKK